MSWLPLTLFPEGGLSSSIVTTVWVGVVVISLMSLRFGWVFSGLVVPGYLVPLLIVKPWAAGIIVVEAVLTLWTVRALAKSLTRSGIACEFFGRDRFLALMIVSCFYRIVADIWVLPFVGEFINSQFGIAFDYRNNLQSFGLIVICLAANQMWKTGLVRGAFPFFFSIIATYLVVRFGLMEFTNFSISNLSYLYENIATSIHAAPKAYIILITTAFVASRMNLIYGWDFNGILIPSLIALQWYEPTKVLTSFVEAIFILYISIFVLKLPFFRTLTIEGPRKMLLFFTVSFLYKMAIGWGSIIYEPTVKVSDFYGFGYLLPTLMAIKMHQGERVLHQIRITGQVSLVSVVIANLIGYSLTFLPASGGRLAKVEALPHTATKEFSVDRLRKEMYSSFVLGHRTILETGKTNAVNLADLQLFEAGIKGLLNRSVDTIAARQNLNAAGFRLNKFADRYFQVVPHNNSSGRPVLLIDRQAKSELAVTCPEAYEHRHLFEASFDIFQNQKARLLWIGGKQKDVAASTIGDYGAIREWGGLIHAVCGHDVGIMEVCKSVNPKTNKLYVKRSMPVDLVLRQIEQKYGSLDTLWCDSDRANPIRDLKGEQYCELHLGGEISRSKGNDDQVQEVAEPIDTVIREACFEFAPRASNLYKPPGPEALLYLDRHVLAPLFNLDSKNLSYDLPAINAAAWYYGYRAIAFNQSGVRYVLLSEIDPRRHWGSVILRIVEEDENVPVLCFEVPSRVRDESVLTFAAVQFRRFRARALIVAGTNTLTNPDATTKLTVASNRDSFFNLAHQVFCRSWANDRPSVVQVRGYLPPLGHQFPVGDLILAPHFGNTPREEIAKSLFPLRTQLQNDGLNISSLAYDDATSPYATGFNIQGRYMDFTNRGAFTLAWLSPFIRQNYQNQEQNVSLLRMIKAVSLPIHQESLSGWLRDREFHTSEDGNSRCKKLITNFRKKSDIGSLAALVKNHEGHVASVLDPSSSQLFLILTDQNDRVQLVANLARNAHARSLPANTDSVQSYIDTRAAWMERIVREGGGEG